MRRWALLALLLLASCAPVRSTLVLDPAGGAEPVATLVLLHGFTREPENHARFAHELADEGVRVVLPDYPSLLGGDRARTEAVAIAVDAVRREHASLGVPVLLGGFSAGAAIATEATARLAAQGAAPDALVLLDPVPWRRTLVAAGDVPAGLPVLALLAPPSSCNAEGSGTTLLAALPPGARTETVADASHCDFESPSDGLCRLVCGDDSAARRERIENAVRGFVRERAAASLARAGPP